MKNENITLITEKSGSDWRIFRKDYLPGQDGEINETFVKEMAQREPLRVVFRDAGFAGDDITINVEQIFKLMSPHTDVKTI